MSREIKFRAWTDNLKDGGEMYYQRENEYFSPTFSPAGYGLLNPSLKIMQYTGLKDKNGKKIFIGDLVKFINPMPIQAKEEIAEVKFVLEDSFLPYIYPFVNISSYNYETKHFEGFGINSKDCEVIGNIYENPELLKEEKND